jgi:iron complex transport system permease protein
MAQYNLINHDRIVRRRCGKVLLLWLILAVVFTASIVVGPSGIRGIFVHEILHDVRLPRTFLAALVGAALAITGTGLQALFQNPLASPSILGISSAAAFGAGLASILNLPVIPTSFFSGILATFLLLKLVRISGAGGRQTIILAGIALGSFFASLLSLILYLAGEKTSRILFWIMGGFWLCNWSKTVYALIWIVPAGIALSLLFREMDLITTGKEAAASMGVDVSRTQTAVLILSSLLVSVCVSVSGIIGFVGLVVPHFVRVWVGPGHKYLLPGSIAGGAILLLIADTVSRSLTLSGEIPVGIFTSFLGIPFFLYILLRVP